MRPAVYDSALDESDPRRPAAPFYLRDSIQESLPRADEDVVLLHLTLMHLGKIVEASDIHGDCRPVQGAVVSIAGQRVITDRGGRAMVRLRVASSTPRSRPLHVHGGDTFTDVRRNVRVR